MLIDMKTCTVPGTYTYSDNHDITEKHPIKAKPWTDSKRVTHDKFETKKTDTDITSNCTGYPILVG